jgi:predicted RNA-binding Zn-ribbon protein involved in translation (DUF1610 family)
MTMRGTVCCDSCEWEVKDVDPLLYRNATCPECGAKLLSRVDVVLALFLKCLHRLGLIENPNATSDPKFVIRINTNPNRRRR